MKLARTLAMLLTCTGATCPALAEDKGLQVVGVVGAANAAPVGRAPDRSVRTLAAGGDIFFHDRIVTRRGDSAQLAFLDRSTLSVGENSDLVIDEFVYKPGSAGTMSASLTRGVLRYVGGDISHNGGTTITTPTVTIGIRGGIGIVGAVEDAAALRDFPGVPRDFQGGTVVVNGYGTLTLRNARSEVVLSKPGFAAFVGSAGEPIGAPIRVSATTAQAMMQKLTSRTGQHGGSSRTVATASIAPRIASLFTQQIAVPAPPAVNALDYTSAFSIGNGLARNRAQVRQVLQLEQALIAQATAAISSGSATGSGSSGSGSSGSNGSGSSGTGSSGSGSGGSGSGSSGSGSPNVNAYQIDVSSVNAGTIYAYSINASIVSADQHPGTPFAGASSLQTIVGTNVTATVITAYMINAGTITADHVYATYVNGLQF